jgi:hypothetical protein
MHVMSRPRSDGMGLKPQEPYEGLGGNIRTSNESKERAGSIPVFLPIRCRYISNGYAHGDEA